MNVTLDILSPEQWSQALDLVFFGMCLWFVVRVGDWFKPRSK